MSLDLLPSEVISIILDCLTPGNDATQAPADRIQSISACTTACKAISLTARQTLFRSIRLWNEKHVSELLGLISADLRIASWINEVVISAESETRDYKTRAYLVAQHSVTAWLDSGSKGGVLMSKLQSAHTLRLMDISADPVDDEVNQVTSWVYLGRLRSVNHVVVERCELPSWRVFISLFGDFFPLLTDVSSYNMKIRPSYLPPGDPCTINLPHLRALVITGSFGSRTSSLPDRLRCANLTSLIMGSSSDAVPILQHAVHLQTLIFVECSSWRDLVPVDLARNPHLAYLGFRQISYLTHHTCITQRIRSLASPSRVAVIEITGRLRTASEDLWAHLDAALSSADFAKGETLGRRTLVLNNAPTRSGVGQPLTDEDVQEIMPLTCGRDWFHITTPSFVPEEPIRRSYDIDTYSMCGLDHVPAPPLPDEDDEL